MLTRKICEYFFTPEVLVHTRPPVYCSHLNVGVILKMIIMMR